MVSQRARPEKAASAKRGTYPTLTHVPPERSFSINATFLPYQPEALREKALPPLPPPIVITSYSFVVGAMAVFVDEKCLDMLESREVGDDDLCDEMTETEDLNGDELRRDDCPVRLRIECCRGGKAGRGGMAENKAHARWRGRYLSSRDRWYHVNARQLLPMMQLQPFLPQLARVLALKIPRIQLIRKLSAMASLHLKVVPEDLE